jgi:hypothetical protein
VLPAWRAGAEGRGAAPRAAGCPLALVLPEANTLGLALLGGRRLSEALDLAAGGDVEVALVVENDLYRRAPTARVDGFLEACPTVLVFDHVTTPTTARATAVMSAAAWAESTGTPPIAGRAPATYLALCAVDAECLGLRRGAVRVTLAQDGAPEARLSLPVRLVPSLPAGLCGLPIGLPQLPFVDLPGEVGIEFGGAARYV